MPEKPEVVTVAKSLSKKIVGKKITKMDVFWDNILEYPPKKEFQKKIVGQVILDVTTRGKWILVELTNDYLLIHLRMEGKFFFRDIGAPRNKHEHVIFTLDDEIEWRYHDVRKFGKMVLISKEEAFSKKPLVELGLEYDDPTLTKEYLYAKLRKKTLPIKTVLLDQSIIAGIGNIYDDEILFLSKISPKQKANTLSKKKCDEIISHTKEVLSKAIEMGGTTIKSYTSEEGVHGRFQDELSIHGRKTCPICHRDTEKIFIGGRGTYYCPNCQK